MVSPMRSGCTVTAYVEIQNRGSRMQTRHNQKYMFMWGPGMQWNSSANSGRLCQKWEKAVNRLSLISCQSHSQVYP